MDHNLAIVAILTVGFTVASLLAYLAQRVGLPSILGYLLAGFIIGPYSPGFVADVTVSEQLAEIGVILMLFGVGLHFKLEDLIDVKNIAIPGAIVQTLASTVIATVIVYLNGWSLASGIIIGLSIGVASTVVLVRVLTDHQLLNTAQGHLAVGWLIVEDIFTVVILILLPTLAAFMDGMNLSVITIAKSVVTVLIQFLFLVLFMFTWGYRVVAYILNGVARLHSHELFTLTVLAVVFTIAAGASFIFGTSIALGAFIAGMVIGKTSVKHQAAANSLPLKDVFAIIFFLSVGMLFNPAAIATHFTLFTGILFIILVIKPLTAYLITLTFGYSLKISLSVALSLAQIGEFSFILAEEAMNLNILPDAGYDILVACALISISLNPLLFQFIDFFQSTIQKWGFFKNSAFNCMQIVPDLKKSFPQAIIIGFGPIGKEISRHLNYSGFMSTIIEQDIDMVTDLEEKRSIIFGDAAQLNILKDAHIEEVTHLIITILDITKTLDIIHTARRANPNIAIMTTIQYIKDQALMKKLKVHCICAELETLTAVHSAMRHFLHST